MINDRKTASKVVWRIIVISIPVKGKLGTAEREFKSCGYKYNLSDPPISTQRRGYYDLLETDLLLGSGRSDQGSEVTTIQIARRGTDEVKDQQGLRSQLHLRASSQVFRSFSFFVPSRSLSRLFFPLFDFSGRSLLGDRAEWSLEAMEWEGRSVLNRSSCSPRACLSLSQLSRSSFEEAIRCRDRSLLVNVWGLCRRLFHAVSWCRTL